MLRVMLKQFAIFFTFLCTIFLGSNVQALDFKSITQVYFFGDSLTDSGFNDLWPTLGIPGLPLPFGKAPTFTTYGGYIWSQYVAHDIKGFALPVYPGPTVADKMTNNSIYPVPNFVSGTLTGINYAAAGSTTNSTGFSETWAPSLHQQISFFLQNVPANQHLDPNALYFVWSGANDFLTLLFSSPSPPTELQLLATSQLAAKNIAHEITRLTDRGAKRIVVLSLPNMGLSPFATTLGIPASLKNASFTFNSMLNTQLGVIVQKNKAKILFVDLYNLLEKVVAAIKAGKPFVIGGQSFKFSNYTDQACAPAISAIYCTSTAPTDYIFADLVHPTDMANRVIALEVERLIQAWN